jgi:hypothetical protein
MRTHIQQYEDTHIQQYEDEYIAGMCLDFGLKVVDIFWGKKKKDPYTAV